MFVAVHPGGVASEEMGDCLGSLCFGGDRAVNLDKSLVFGPLVPALVPHVHHGDNSGGIEQANELERKEPRHVYGLRLISLYYYFVVEFFFLRN